MSLRRMTAIAAVLTLPFAALSPAARAQPAAPAEPAVVYAARPGDNLYALAARYFVRQSDALYVQRLNRITQPRRIPIGRRITIPAEMLRSQPITARLTAYSGAVAVTGPRAGATARDMPITEGFELSTGANAFLTFEMPDGSRVTLPSQSRMRIDRLRRVLINGALQRDFRLLEGRSSTVVTKQAPINRFRIGTPLTVSAVRGTEFRVGHDRTASISTTEVLEGAVANAAGSAEALLPAGFGAAATPAGLGETKALLPPPTLKDATRVQDEPELSFVVAGPDGAVSWRAQIATDDSFANVIAETTATAPKLTLTGVGDGAFFVRLTALDATPLEGLPTVHAFQRQLYDLILEAPVAVAGARPGWRFRWRTPGKATETYRFILGRAPDGADPVVEQTGLPEKEIVVTGLAPGVYYWRVSVSRPEGDTLREKRSRPQRFEIGG